MNNELSELFDVMETLPDSSALSNDLSIYVEALDEFFPYIAKQFIVRQKARHQSEKDTYFPEELQQEEQALHTQICGALARSINGSALVVIYSTFELTTLDYAKYASGQLKLNPFNPSTEKGQFIVKAQRYYREVLGINLFGSREETAALDTLKALRHSFVHQQSSIPRLPKWLKDDIRSRKNRLALCHDHSEIWIPSIECIRSHAHLVQHWASGLFDRTAKRITEARLSARDGDSICYRSPSK